MYRRKFISTLAFACLTLPLSVFAEAPSTPKRLAIWPLDSFAGGGSFSGDDLQMIREIIPDMLTSALAANDQVELVERQKLLEILNEQKLGASDLADEETRLRLGRMLGARYMLFGSYLKLGPVWQIDLRMVDAESSQILTSVSADQHSGDVLNAVQQLARDLIPLLPPR